jgi:CDP-6-deoxy-D-xylo-4-hexulose-3-dehydrase
MMDAASRVNTLKPQKYWYPLSIATYGVEEVLAAVDSLCSFRTSMWEKTAEFERQFAPLHDCNEGVMVNSGSSADLVIAFGLVDPRCDLLAPGDEILLPSVTWPTHVWSCLMAGLTPVLVDTDPRTLNMSMDDLEGKITDRTRAIFPVHLMGNPCDMNRIAALVERHDLVLVEDCCEALNARFDGRPVGSFGEACSFSFFFSHHLTTMEGGMVGTSNAELSDVFRLLRAHGWVRDTKYLEWDTSGIDRRYSFAGWGFNLRPTELQSAFGLEQMRRVREFHEVRVNSAEYLLKALRPYAHLLRPIEVQAEAECSWFAFPLMVTDDSPFSRADLVAYLENAGVETRPIVAGSLARQPASERFPSLARSVLPGADEVHDRGFYIGIYPFDVQDRLDRLATTFETYLKKFT